MRPLRSEVPDVDEKCCGPNRKLSHAIGFGHAAIVTLRGLPTPATCDPRLVCYYASVRHPVISDRLRVAINGVDFSAFRRRTVFLSAG